MGYLKYLMKIQRIEFFFLFSFFFSFFPMGVVSAIIAVGRWSCPCRSSVSSALRVASRLLVKAPSIRPPCLTHSTAGSLPLLASVLR
jgi:hypothetical protein